MWWSMFASIAPSCLFSNRAEELLHGKEEVVHADAGYTGADKRIERPGLKWEISAGAGRSCRRMRTRRGRRL
jgi:IS5 family transposase